MRQSFEDFIEDIKEFSLIFNNLAKVYTKCIFSSLILRNKIIVFNLMSLFLYLFFSGIIINLLEKFFFMKIFFN